jgi:hypothetical protein
MLHRIRNRFLPITTSEQVPARVLRATAGAPAAMAKSRRGSFLVLVVGTLALLSVITLVYVTLGNQDTRTQVAVAKRDRLDQVPLQVSEYISGIIAEDAIATQYSGAPEGTPPNSLVRLERETTDYPGTLFDYRSGTAVNSVLPAPLPLPPQGVYRLPFSPSGSAPSDASNLRVNAMPFWPASDPWLAATSPTFLDAAGAGPTDPTRTYIDARDWSQISNINPDGRYVNLAYLRGNFTAGPNALTQGLSVFQPDGSLGTTNDLGVDLTDPAVLDTPAYFQTRQTGLFRPVKSFDGKTVFVGNRNTLPGSANYPLYQFADADGDGYLDSRWQDLVDGRLPGNVPVIDLPPNYRFFFATRIVDLSGRVNVNTASDSRTPSVGALGVPAQTVASGTSQSTIYWTGASNGPAGLNAGEVDLQRLLRQTDAIESYGASYEFLTQGRALASTRPAPAVAPAFDYGLTLPTQNDRISLWGRVGDSGYLALRLSLAANAVPDARFMGVQLPVPTAAGVLPLVDDIANPSFAGQVNLLAEPAVDRWNFNSFFAPNIGVNTAANTPPAGTAEAYVVPSTASRGALASRLNRFLTTNAQFESTRVTFNDPTVLVGSTLLYGNVGPESLAELLSYNVLNDPNYTSVLESIIGGREPSLDGSGTVLDAAFLSPLRENRPLIDAQTRFPVERPGYPASVAADITDLSTVGLGTDAAFNASQLLFATDIRQHLTTISGARIFRPGYGVSSEVITPTEVALQANGRPAVKLGETRLAAQDACRFPEIAFAGYYAALAPFATDITTWSQTASFLPNRTLAYGARGPELAALTAAHMAVNLADASDFNFRAGTDTTSTPKPEPTSFTVVFDNRIDPTNPIIATAYPPLANVNNAAPPAPAPLRLDATLDPTGAQLPITSSDATVPAVNVFGIEPQPFLTQVSCFTLLTDAPSSVAGASPESTEVTIQTDPVASNPDFICRVIAFQLHNPFDQPVELSRLRDPNTNVASPAEPLTNSLIDDNESFYYVHFRGRNYKLAELVEASSGGFYNVPAADGALDTTVAGITIPPRGTVVCYALSQPLRSIQINRIGKADPTLTGLPDENSKILAQRLIENLVKPAGTSYDPPIQIINIPEIISDPSAPAYGRAAIANPVNPSGFTDIFDIPPFASLATLADRQTVQLWRSVRSGDELLPANPNAMAIDVPADPNTPGLYCNDQLMDRMQVPSMTELLRDPGSQLIKVNDTDIAANPADDSGLTVAFFGSLRRPGEAVLSGKLPLGGVPAFCLEPKRTASGNPWNIQWNDVDNGSPTDFNLDDSDFAPAKRGRDTLAQFRQQTDDIAQLARTEKAPVEFDPAQGSVDNGQRVSVFPAIYDTTAINYRNVFPTSGAAPLVGRLTLARNRPVFFGPNNEFDGPNGRFSGLRAGDMLLPWAIGPVNAPLDWAGNPIDDQLQSWTTLGEAMATALGYESIAPAVGASDPTVTQFTVAATGTPVQVFDGVQLRLDDFVPFIDNNETTADHAYFQPATDYRRGSTPLALTVVDQFFTNSSGALAERSDRAIQGLVNLNTAPIEVLRLLPNLSPPPDNQGWWANNITAPNPVGTFRYSAAPTVADQTAIGVDIAPTIIAFRDKVRAEPRPGTFDPAARPPASLISSPIIPPDFSYLTSDVARPDNRLTDDIRARFAGIPGVGEQPGLSSLGALLNARFLDLNATITQAALAPEAVRAAPYNIDFLGYDRANAQWTTTGNGRNSSMRGMDSTLHLANNWNKPPTIVIPPTATSPQAAPDEVANDYAEKLLIANGVWNSTSTRSDYFAVWFLMHGYRREDVDNLAPNEAMTPTLARRFVMVVDRSGVVNRGDKAKIVLFKEVPIN